MSPSRRWVAALWLGGMFTAAALPAPAADEFKIGFVDPRRIESESKTAIDEYQAIRKEFDPRNAELEKLQTKLAGLDNQLKSGGATMKDADHDALARDLASGGRQFEQMKQQFAEDLEQRKREAFQHIVERARLAIKEVADAGKYDLIFEESLYASKQVDITDDVLKAMAR